MELEKEFKLGTQQVIGLYNELTDFLGMNKNSMGSRDYPNIREQYTTGICRETTKTLER